MNHLKTINSIISKFLRSDTFKPFGLELLNKEIVICNNQETKSAAATDYKHIFIYPEDSLFKDCGVSFEQCLIFLLLHEICHNIFMHDKRKKLRDSILWNYACDFMINLFLKNIELENRNWETQVNLLKMDIQTFEKLICLDDSFSNMIEEEIYEKLKSEGNYKNKEKSISYKDFLDDIGVNSDGINPDLKVNIKNTQLDYKGKTFKKTFVEFPEVNQSEEQENKKLTDSSLAKTMFENNILSKGFESKEFEKFLKKIFDVNVAWQTILQDSIFIELQKSSDISYGKPRMVWLSNPTLPYLPNYYEEEVLGTIVILIDESASVNDEDIQNAIGIVQQSSSYYKNIFVIKHDTKTNWEKLYSNKLSDDDIDELLIRRHSGGTSHKDAFNRVVEFSKKSDSYISLVLSITDMVSDIPSAQNILPDRIPRIYLQTDIEYEIDNIKGKIIKLK